MRNKVFASTQPLTPPRCARLRRKVVNIRANTEGLTMEEEALILLGEIGANTSLRYVVQLLTPASILAKTSGRDSIARDDIEDRWVPLLVASPCRPLFRRLFSPSSLADRHFASRASLPI